MGNTKIPWAEKVWNPITGCTKISPGCQNCYAERMANRLRGRCGYPADEPFRVTLHPDRLEEPLRWRKPSMVFVCSMGDLFHEDIPESFISAVFYVMQVANQHSFLILTKRPARMAEFLDRWVHCDHAYPDYAWHIGAGSNSGRPYGYGHYRAEGKRRPPLPNVWLGVTVENQEMADLRIPILLQIPAVVRFVSVEPMLGPVDLTAVRLPDHLQPDWAYGMPYGITFDALQPNESHIYDSENHLDWVICGGETGPHARPVHPDWVRNLRDQCQAAGVPFFFKQWGEWAPVQRNNDSNQVYIRDGLTVTAKKFACLDKQGRDVLDLPGLWDEDDVDMAFVGKKVAGDILDGRQYHEFPEVTR